MAGVPAYCTHCGAIFQCPWITIEPGATATTFIGMTTKCANCKSDARIVDGTFDVSSEDVLLMTSGPPISRAVLISFANLVDRVAKEEITVDELQEEVDRLDPSLGRILTKLRAKHFGVAGLIILVMFLKSCNFHVEAKVDVNELFDQWTGHGSKSTYTQSVDHDAKKAKE